MNEYKKTLYLVTYIILDSMLVARVRNRGSLKLINGKG